MRTAMTPDLFWLAATTVMTGLLWIPHVVNRFKELGAPSMNWYPPPDPPHKAAWAERAMRAHENAVENLVIFAPLALAVYASGSGTGVTATACMIYFFARVAHYLIGIFGLPIPPRTVAFLVGVGAQMTLGVTLLLHAAGTAP